MIAAWDRVPNQHKIHALTFVLVAVCMAAAFGGGLLAHAPTITRSRDVPQPIRQAADLYKALGRPQGQVDVQGHKCDGWAVGAVTVLACP